jgi:hypothetical protein
MSAPSTSNNTSWFGQNVVNPVANWWNSLPTY